MSIRTDRVAGEIQQALGLLFQREFSDLSDGLLTVTKVRMSPDLKNGRVYLSILGGTRAHDKTLKMIQDAQPQIRHGLAKQVRVKYVPELRFYLDDTQENVAHIEDIFKRIREERGDQDPPVSE
jgi:ribosome-binding factor A